MPGDGVPSRAGSKSAIVSPNVSTLTRAERACGPDTRASGRRAHPSWRQSPMATHECVRGSSSAKAKRLEHEGIAAHQHIDADVEVLSMHGQRLARILDAREAGG